MDSELILLEIQEVMKPRHHQVILAGTPAIILVPIDRVTLDRVPLDPVTLNPVSYRTGL